MPNYKAPLRDMHFAMHELLDIENTLGNLWDKEYLSSEALDPILQECAKFAENELSPLFRTGDEEGCRYEHGKVITPTGFKNAYQHYVDGGWPSIKAPEVYGGQALPNVLCMATQEICGSANVGWGLYSVLSQGAIETIKTHGTDQQKSFFLPNLIKGDWTGTMCLTEAQCGSDLGQIRTKAIPNDDGSYAISGTKIFISSGEHDLTENIVHIVLARLPDAPEGTRGISLFIVPKINLDSDGALADRNGVNCGSIEKKMGIKGSATCVMNFDDAKGYLIGPENKGLSCMFTFMNEARLGVANQGVMTAEASFQGALDYATERLSMRALSGTKYPDKAADPILVHPDVRRMILTQKAFAEGGRALILYLASLSDIKEYSTDEKPKKTADDLMSFLTPIAKAFLTEVGCESANLGVQVYGGHGFIREWGMEQIVRDARISTLYEGTTGIQALDLLGRKVLQTQGQSLRNFTDVILSFCTENKDNNQLKPYLDTLQQLVKEWLQITAEVGMKAMKNRDEIGAASVDYLMYSGYITLAYFWARSACVAMEKSKAADETDGFYQTKITVAKFYFDRILPRTRSLVATMSAPIDAIMGLEETEFRF